MATETDCRATITQAELTALRRLCLAHEYRHPAFGAFEDFSSQDRAMWQLATLGLAEVKSWREITTRPTLRMFNLHGAYYFARITNAGLAYLHANVRTVAVSS